MISRSLNSLGSGGRVGQDPFARRRHKSANGTSDLNYRYLIEPSRGPQRDAEPWCGVQIINLQSGDIVEWIRLEGGVSELFDVRVLSGVRRPTAACFLTDEIHRAFTIDVE
jgi:hypothetical protein